MKLLLSITLILFNFSNWALAFEDKDDTFARVLEHGEEGKSIFEKSADGLIIIQRKFNAGGLLIKVIEFKLNLNELPLSCKIYDSQGSLIYLIRYGYDRNTGLLKEEQIVDYKNPIIHPKTGMKVPSFRYRYTYDSFGKANKPEVIEFNPDKKNRDYLKTIIWESDPLKANTN